MNGVLSILGLAVICYAVWRTVALLVEDWTRSSYVRDVMEGGEPAPWEPETVRIRRPLYDVEDEPERWSTW